MSIKHLRKSGSAIYAHLDDNTVVQCVYNGAGYWLAAKSTTPPDPPDPPDPGEWTNPLPGATLTSGYGPRAGSFHAGIDLSTVGGTGPGSMILATTAMRITVARESGTGGLADAGTYVKGWTVAGPLYTFSHFHGVPGSIVVAVDQVVQAGEPLMREGNSGNSFGTHLHLEIWDGHLGPGSVAGVDGPWYWGDGTPPDPLPILNANGVTF